jgi:hypothetical protein
MSSSGKRSGNPFREPAWPTQSVPCLLLDLEHHHFAPQLPQQGAHFSSESWSERKSPSEAERRFSQVRSTESPTPSPARLRQRPRSPLQPYRPSTHPTRRVVLHSSRCTSAAPLASRVSLRVLSRLQARHRPHTGRGKRRQSGCSAVHLHALDPLPQLASVFFASHTSRCLLGRNFWTIGLVKYGGCDPLNLDTSPPLPSLPCRLLSHHRHSASLRPLTCLSAPDSATDTYRPSEVSAAVASFLFSSLLIARRLSGHHCLHCPLLLMPASLRGTVARRVRSQQLARRL